MAISIPKPDQNHQGRASESTYLATTTSSSSTTHTHTPRKQPPQTPNSPQRNPARLIQTQSSSTHEMGTKRGAHYSTTPRTPARRKAVPLSCKPRSVPHERET
ncbi:hypothetical protein KC19_3G247300 [Ceratodon purpureus]|uniref:Uncharacterized protein n=1 Tax=Ceratodon purpureus TaxID=3225 RepID=A0A8T0IQ89_CERPU|nr:hypothetical protein KC19_3G247300 [Ceratodon purpureus]